MQIGVDRVKQELCAVRLLAVGRANGRGAGGDDVAKADVVEAAAWHVWVRVGAAAVGCVNE